MSLQTTDEIVRFLIERASAYTNRPTDQFSPSDRFRSLGLDSIGLVGLSGDLEEKLGRRVSPEWMYEHDTLRELAAFLAQTDVGI